MMNFELLRIAIAVVFTSIAAWQDSKTSYVSDWVLYSLVGAGFLLNVLSFDLGFFLSTLPFAVLISLVGYFLWRRGSFGQGDVWLFLGLQLLLPEYPSFSQIALPSFPFAASVFLASSFFSVIGSSVFYLNELQKRRLLGLSGAGAKGMLLRLGVIVGAVVLLILVIPVPSLLAKGFFAVFAAAALFFALFLDVIKEKVIVQWVPLKEIEDEDVLVVEKMPQEIVRKYSLGKVLTRSEVEKIKRIIKSGKMRKFPVMKNLIRFNPYVLLGLLACLYAGDLMIWLLFQ